MKLTKPECRLILAVSAHDGALFYRSFVTSGGLLAACDQSCMSYCYFHGFYDNKLLFTEGMRIMSAPLQYPTDKVFPGA